MLVVKHDFDLPEGIRLKAPGWKWPKLGQAPEVFPIFVDPSRLHGTARTRLDDGWINYLRELNPGLRKWRYIQNVQTGLFNTAGFPQMESLTCGGNVVRFYEIREIWGEEWGRIMTMSYYNVPTADKVNHFTHPWLIHRFVCITRDGRIVDPPPGQIYFPLVAKVPLWMPLSSFYV